jgi:ubiquinone/menaquinone biosynthesis C-methylase UbiE
MEATATRTFSKDLNAMASYSAFAAHYDKFCEDIDYKNRAIYFDSLLTNQSKNPRGLLLDLACGTGALSVEMSKLGYDVIGVDSSVRMLDIAARRVALSGQKITLINQRMEQLDLFGTVEYCVCALDGINHLKDLSAVRKVFERLALFIAPGGCFVFDANTPYKHKKVLADNTFVFENINTVCIWRNRTRGLITDMALDFFVGQKDDNYKRSSERIVQRAFRRSSLEKCLNQCGFETDAVFADDTYAPPDETTQRYIFLTTRR